MASLPEPDRTLIHQLIDAAARDLAGYADEGNPNRAGAGRAALRGIEAAIRALSIVRDALLRELYSEPAGQHGEGQPEANGEAGGYVPGNSGPGF